MANEMTHEFNYDLKKIPNSRYLCLRTHERLDQYFKKVADINRFLLMVPQLQKADSAFSIFLPLHSVHPHTWWGGQSIIGFQFLEEETPFSIFDLPETVMYSFPVKNEATFLFQDLESKKQNCLDFLSQKGLAIDSLWRVKVELIPVESKIPSGEGNSFHVQMELNFFFKNYLSSVFPHESENFLLS